VSFFTRSELEWSKGRREFESRPRPMTVGTTSDRSEPGSDPLPSMTGNIVQPVALGDDGSPPGCSHETGRWGQPAGKRGEAHTLATIRFRGRYADHAPNSPTCEVDNMTRRERLRCVFDGRKRQLKAAEDQPAIYGEAVEKYVRARRAWRKCRGWS